MNAENSGPVLLPPNHNLTGGRRGKSIVPIVAPRCGLISVTAQAIGMSAFAIARRFEEGRWPAHLRTKDGRQWVYNIDGIMAFLFDHKEELGE